MKLIRLLNSFTLLATSTLLVSASYNEFNELEAIHQLVKREDKLPFDSLPNGNCTAPEACANINQPASCRCNDILTVCQNTQGQFCWGSKTLNQNSNCPVAPSSCSSSFNGTASCLCNSQAVLCVDQHNHYCYGNIAAGSSVSLAAIPTGAQSLPSANSSLPSNLPGASQSISGTAAATATQSFATQLSLSSQQIGWMVCLALCSFVLSI